MPNRNKNADLTAEVLEGYESVSSKWIEDSELIPCEQLLAPVLDLLPQEPSRVADLGAGTGRDAAWLANQGHSVLAVEPAAALRNAGIKLHQSSTIKWLDDSLPDLKRIKDGERFGTVLLLAVWQHLNDIQRITAMRRLSELTTAGGVVIISLRHGPGAPNRPVHQVMPADTIRDAHNTGFSLIRERTAASMGKWNQSSGVHWTWLVFQRN